MANTKTLTKLLVGKKEAIIYYNLAYVDTATESDVIIFDSSDIASDVGDTDPLDSTIISLYASVNSAATARCWLEWDATTDVLAMAIPTGQSPLKANFRSIGGLPNQGGSGKTGDIFLNATGLGTGDTVTLILHVRRD